MWVAAMRRLAVIWLLAAAAAGQVTPERGMEVDMAV
jgi:hypothetical protein